MLGSLSATHPEAEAIVAHLDWLGAGQLVAVSAAPERALVASFDTPKGARTLR